MKRALISEAPLSIVVLVICLVPVVAAGRPGLALRYPYDQGIENDPSVLLHLDFDDQQQTEAWYAGKTAYGWTDAPENVFAGGGALEIQQIQGTHLPSDTTSAIAATDVAYLRWYAKWQAGYDWTAHKRPGLYARVPGAPPGGGAGERPDGYDKYSCRLSIGFDRIPHFYTYHPDQFGDYGDSLLPNLVDLSEVVLEDSRWYCFEIMLKANDADILPFRDGELKMWIDGRLVGHYEKMRFRETNDLKINWLSYSAYVGGDWVSQQKQNLWDDQIVVATEYIGPLADPASPYWPTLTPEVKYLGDGLYGVTFTAHGNDGQQKSFFADMSFQGANGGVIQQAKAVIIPGVLEHNVDTEADANLYDGQGTPPYEKDRDSYFLEPFSSGDVMALTAGENYYHVEAGTGAGGEYEVAPLAYIVTTGDVSFSGAISRLAWNYDAAGVAEMPAPGDANLDGLVDGGDYTIWCDNYQQAGPGWAGGDFNGSGIVDGGDYTIWADFYLPSGGAVPEPAATVLIALGSVSLLRRRWRI